MTTEAIAAIVSTEAAAATASASARPAVAATSAAGVGFSLTDVARFESFMAPGAARSPAASTGVRAAAAPDGAQSQTLRDFIGPLDKINSSTDRFVAASERLALDPNVGPGAMLMTMVGVQRFMLECQLTSSVANRASDGIQELFRQQS
jgi:hypothetical protein